MNQEGHTALEISTAKNVPASVRVLKVRREGGKGGRGSAEDKKEHACNLCAY